MAKDPNKKEEEKKEEKKFVELVARGYYFKPLRIVVWLLIIIALLLADLFLTPAIADGLDVEPLQMPTPLNLSLWAITLIALAGVLFIASLEEVGPKEVALGRYFGHVERREKHGKKPRNSNNGIWGSGLHFIPPLPGIKLVRLPKEFLELVYEKDPNEPKTWIMSGTMIQVRSKNRQKLLVEATFFLRIPYDNVDMLILIIESGVPINDEDKLRGWLARAIDPELTTVFGKKNYLEVIGGLKNGQLNRAVNKRIQAENSLLCRSGLFADDATRDDPGTGEAYIRFKYIHVSGPLGERLEQVETKRLEAEADKEVAKVRVATTILEAKAKRFSAKVGEETAKSIAVKEAEETHGRVFLMVAQSAGLTVAELKTRLAGNDGQKLRGKPASEGGYKEAFEAAYDQVRRDRAGDQGELRDIRVGNTDGTPLEGATGLVALVSGVAGAIAEKFGQAEEPSKKPKPLNERKKKNGGGSEPVKDDTRGSEKKKSDGSDGIEETTPKGNADLDDLDDFEEDEKGT